MLVRGYDTYHLQLAPPDSNTADAAISSPPLPENQLVGVIDLHTRHLDGQVGGFGDLGYPSVADWSPDGSRLVVGSMVGTMRVVAARNLAPLSAALPASTGDVQSVSFSPDGNTIVSGSSDGTMTFWDSNTLRALGSPILSAIDGSWWAWFRHDGTVAGYAPGAADGTEQWFTTPAQPDQWLKLACQLAGTSLTRDEWNRYIGAGRPYRLIC